MRWLFPLIVIAASQTWASAQELTEEEKKEGFISLFHGKDFSGFRFMGGAKDKPPANWKVEEGMIRLSGGGSPNLATQWDFDDFDARFQWKPLKEGYNSGFFVRTPHDKGLNQINLAQKACGQLLGGPKGSKAVPELQKKPGEWNEWRVLAKGDKLTFWCNGTQAWEVTGFKPERGYLGWQAEGAAIDFKNIRVKELGFESLNDPKLWNDSEGWTLEDGAFKKGPKARALITPKRYKNFVFRMEWRDGFKPNTQVEFGGGRPAKLHMSMEDLRKASNPPGEWNYMELTVKDKKGSVWLNGHQVLKDEKLEPDTVAGPILLISGMEAVAFRNLRIKTLPD